MPVWLLLVMQICSGNALAQAPDRSERFVQETAPAFFQKHCLSCHSGASAKGKTRLDNLLASDWADRHSTWVKVVEQIESRSMPPADKPAPAAEEVDQFLTELQPALKRRLLASTRVPADFAEYARLMIDLLVAALATDSVRVGSLMLGVEISNRNYPEINVRNSHHEVSHHGNDPARLAKYKAIGTYHLSFFAYLLDRLKATREGDRTLLDRSQVMFGCCIGDGNRHNYDHLPVLLAGRGNGSLRPGFHRRYPAETPIANLYLAMLHQAGVQALRFADSTAPLGQLT